MRVFVFFCISFALALLMVLAIPRPVAALTFNPCAAPAGLPAGTVINQREMARPEGTRWFCVVVPPGYTQAVDYPTLFVFHGGNGNPQSMMASGKRIITEGLAANGGAGYVMVFALGMPRDLVTCPDPTVPCSSTSWGQPENIDFLNDLILYADGFNLDRDRIFLAGFSGGARLIYRSIEADRLALPVKGIATAAGSMGNLQIADVAAGFPVTNVTIGTPVNAILFQGGADPRMAYDGGLSDGDSEVHLNYRIKIDLFRVLTDTVGVAGVNYPLGGPATGTRWTGPTHSLIATTEPGTGHIWPGDLSPHMFGFFDSL